MQISIWQWDGSSTSEETHLRWMREAMVMTGDGGHPIQCSIQQYANGDCQAEEALAAGEVPVGCIFVRDRAVIAKARNRTNELRNVSTFHAV